MNAATETHTYTIVTDAFQTTVQAESLDDAIQAVAWGVEDFIEDEDGLREVFEALQGEGAWCRIDEDGIAVFEVGKR